MPESIPSIKDFPHDGRTWRVDWFGAVERNPNVPSEPTIQVILSPLVPDHEDPASNKSVIYEERQSIRIGVGQLPIVSVGSLWEMGYLLNQSAGNVEQFHNLVISPSTVQLIQTNYAFKGKFLIPPFYHQVGPHGMHAHCLVVEYNNDPFGIIIPVPEVIRFYYASSSDLAHAVFAGDFKDRLTTIINPKGTSFDPEEKRYILKLRKEFEDADAWTIGRILNSTEAFNGAMQIHNSLERESINRKRYLYPETSFPFVGNTNIRARVKRIKSDDKWRYLVFALEHCTGPFPFDHLVLDRDNRNIGAREEEEGPEEEKREAFRKREKPPEEESEDAEIENTSEPSKYSYIQRIHFPRDQFGAVSNIGFEKFIPEDNPYKSAKTIPPDDMSTERLGTGEGVYSENDVGAARLVTHQIRSQALQASLTNFAASVEALNEIDGCTASIRPPSSQTAYVPLLKPPHQRQWSYLDSAQCIHRQVMIADVCVEGRYFSMVEFEWRENEHFKLVLLLNPGNSYPSNASIACVLMSMAKEQGRWEKISNLPGGIQMLTMMHTWSSEKHCANTIKYRIFMR